VPPELRIVVVGGEKASAEAYNRWRKAVGARVRWINSYGPTETSISATFYEPSGIQELELLPIGRPMANTQAYLLDRYLNPVPVGVAGELHIGGVGVARGYLNQSELTSEKFIADPFSSDPKARLYKTGDAARYLPSGDIDFIGRRDEQVKVRGFRVELGEIEDVLSRHPAIRETAVVAQDDRSGLKRLVAFFVPAATPSPSAADLRQFLARQMPEYMVPYSFVPVAVMPLTPNGKIDRLGLRHIEAVEVSKEVVATNDELQSEMVRIWQDVLGRRPISIRDNLFELGGQSLLAARMMYRLGRFLGKTLPLAMLVEAPTVEQLSALLRRASSSHWSSIVPLQPAGSQPPLFCVHGVGGNVVGFRQLAQLLSPDFPLYGMQAQGLDGTRLCYARIEEMAAHYIDEMRAVQPQGPYFLAGYSFGGLVAYEMAQQLRASGNEVGLLALLDTSPRNLKPVAGSVLRLVVAPPSRRQLTRMPRALKKSLERRIRTWLLPEELKRVLRSNHTAGNRYTPQPYFGKITLFRASEESFRSAEALQSAWSGLALGGLDVHTVAGDHGDILVAPQVVNLAEQLKHCIEKAQRDCTHNEAAEQLA